MKVRISNNELRFRLDVTDVHEWCANARVGLKVELLNGHSLNYVLELSGTSHWALESTPSQGLRLHIPATAVTTWADDETSMGLYHEIEGPDGKFLRLSIEKDFACKPGSDQSESSRYFPRPKDEQLC